ncbi:MAG TPA: hypothetical protein GX707_03545 [Epulopiscium sp.]|nr:hypothetical protein [Candidatus Epulonipiscium sp.]
MKPNLIHVAILALSIVLFSCKEDNTPPSAPTYSYGDSHDCVDLVPTLRWNPSTDAENNKIDYTLLLGKTEDNLDEIATNISTSYYTLKKALEDNTKYVWQVIASDGKDETPSEKWSFSTRVNPLVIIGPTSVILDTPEIGGFIFDVNAYTVAFSWIASEDQNNVTYTIYIDPLNGNQANTVKVEDMLNTHAQIILPLGSWEWYIVAIDIKGNTTKSNILKLTLE